MRESITAEPCGGDFGGGDLLAGKRRIGAGRFRAHSHCGGPAMIRKLPSGGYRLYSRKKNPKTGRRRNLGTFKTRGEAEQHERAVQFYKRH
jgi:hypothetical protein